MNEEWDKNLLIVKYIDGSDISESLKAIMNLS